MGALCAPKVPPIAGTPLLGGVPRQWARSTSCGMWDPHPWARCLAERLDGRYGRHWGPDRRLTVTSAAMSSVPRALTLYGRLQGSDALITAVRVVEAGRCCLFLRELSRAVGATTLAGLAQAQGGAPRLPLPLRGFGGGAPDQMVQVSSAARPHHLGDGLSEGCTLRRGPAGGFVLHHGLRLPAKGGAGQ